IDAAGHARLLDFGLAIPKDAARATRGPHVVGTPAYFAPECARGDAPSERGDVYALGVILYQMLTGAHPLGSFSRGDVVAKVLNESPRPMRDHGASVHPDVEALCMRAMSKDPAPRPACARALASALARLREGRPLEDDGEARRACT